MTTISRAAELIDLILRPATHEQLAEAWGRSPVLVRGWRGKFDGLLGEGEFTAALATGRPRVATLHPADPAEPLTAAHTAPVAPSDVEAELAAGRTVCVSDLSAASPRLSELADAFVERLGWHGAARFNAFLSPPGSGADLHVDARVTISLQVQGSKRWWYGDHPAVAWPRSNAQLLPDGTPVWMYPWCGSEPWEALDPVDRSELTEVVLEPGDLLCLPAGTWHAARAVERSFALNLSVSPADPARFLALMLDRELQGEPLWRGGLHCLDAARGREVAELLARAATVLQRSADELGRGPG